MIDICSPPAWVSFDRDLSVEVLSEWLFLLKYVVELDFDLEVRYVELEPMELEDKDFPRLSELFLMIFVAVLLQSELSASRNLPQQR